jgi:hypothetical protein
MSLINDALRRAKDAQQQTPPTPPPDLPFRPVEPEPPRARRGAGLLLPIVLVVIALLTLLFAWQWVQKRNAPAATQANAIPAIEPAAPPAATVATAPVPAMPPDSSSAPATGKAVTPANDPTPTTTNAVATDTPARGATNPAAITPPLAPKPPPLRLQGILFNPRQPTAIIGGKTLFVGDKLGDLRVVAINKDSATLIGAGQTNVLILGE